jgi:hypothetical protein
MAVHGASERTFCRASKQGASETGGVPGAMDRGRGGMSRGRHLAACRRVACCVVRPRQKLQMTSLRTSQFAGGPQVVPVAFNRIVMLIGYADPAETFVTCPNQDVVYGGGYCALDTKPIIFQVPDFGGASGSAAGMTGGPRSSPRSASRTAPGRGSTCWLARTGAVRFLRCHGGGALVHGVAVRGPVYFPERHGLPCRLWRLLTRDETTAGDDRSPAAQLSLVGGSPWKAV